MKPTHELTSQERLISQSSFQYIWEIKEKGRKNALRN